MSAGEGRRFGLAVGGAFLALAALLTWRDHATAALVVGAAGASLVAAALLLPARLGPVHAAWMSLASGLSRITNPVFLAVVYFGVITPVGLLVRLTGRNALARRTDDAGYWITRDPSSRRSDLKRLF